MASNTSIVNLQAHDTLISVRDKLAWAKTRHILLRWPSYEAVHLNEVDLRILQRHGRSLGARLGLVTRRREVLRQAKELGIPVFQSTAAAQRGLWPPESESGRRKWRPPRRDLRQLQSVTAVQQARWQSVPGVRLTAFTAGVLAVLGLAAVLLPRAEITLHPQQTIDEIQVTLPLLLTDSEPRASDGLLPRSMHAEIGIEKSSRTTGLITMPQSRAAGTARFTNTTAQESQIPSGTIVLSVDGSIQRYRTTETVTMPAGPGETVDVPIEALEPGATGNLAEGEVTVLEGQLASSLRVANITALTGGMDRKVPGPSEADVAALRTGALEEARALAIAQFESMLRSADVFLEGTVAQDEILEESITPALGDAGDELKLTMRIEFAGLYLPREEIDRLAATLFGEPQPGYIDGGTTELRVLQVQAPGGSQSEITVQARRTTLRAVDTAAAGALVRGRRPVSALRILDDSLGLRRPPEIRLQPFWWPWLPLSPTGLDFSFD